MDSKDRLAVGILAAALLWFSALLPPLVFAILVLMTLLAAVPYLGAGRPDLAVCRADAPALSRSARGSRHG